MSKTYLNTKTGLTEYVSNDKVIKLYDESEIYRPIDDSPKFIKKEVKKSKNTKDSTK